MLMKWNYDITSWQASAARRWRDISLSRGYELDKKSITKMSENFSLLGIYKFTMT